MIEAFRKKLIALRGVAVSSARPEVLAGIDDLLQWLIGDRSLQQHRCCQAFITYLWESYGDNYGSRANFVDDLKLSTGFCEKTVTMAEIQGERVKLIKYKPHSLSFGECSQKRHGEFFDALKIHAAKKWGVEFEAWFSEWQLNPELI